MGPPARRRRGPGGWPHLAVSHQDAPRHRIRRRRGDESLTEKLEPAHLRLLTSSPTSCPRREPRCRDWLERPPSFIYLAPAQSARGLAHSKMLRVHQTFCPSRQRRGVQWPSTAFPHCQASRGEPFCRPAGLEIFFRFDPRLKPWAIIGRLRRGFQLPLLNLIQRHAAPHERRDVEVFAFVNRRLALVEPALGDDRQRQLLLQHPR
jgi:hypothetical protein